MNDREKNDSLLNWRHIYLATRLMNCPFDGDFMPVNEYLHDDGLGGFLALRGGMSSCEQYGVHYLAPAPESCPMRLAFEVGEITWSEYWLSRPILVRWDFSIFDKSYVATKFVQPSELSGTARFLIDFSEHDCPLEKKLCSLRHKIKHYEFFGQDPSKSEAAYRAFLPVYERRMGKKAA